MIYVRTLIVIQKVFWSYAKRTNPRPHLTTPVSPENFSPLRVNLSIIPKKDKLIFNVRIKLDLYSKSILRMLFLKSIGIVLFHWLISKDSDWLKSIFIRKLTSQHRFWVSQRVSRKFQGKDHQFGSNLAHVNLGDFLLKKRPNFIKFYGL